VAKGGRRVGKTTRIGVETPCAVDGIAPTGVRANGFAIFAASSKAIKKGHTHVKLVGEVLGY